MVSSLVIQLGSLIFVRITLLSLKGSYHALLGRFLNTGREQISIHSQSLNSRASPMPPDFPATGTTGSNQTPCTLAPIAGQINKCLASVKLAKQCNHNDSCIRQGKLTVITTHTRNSQWKNLREVLLALYLDSMAWKLPVIIVSSH